MKPTRTPRRYAAGVAALLTLITAAVVAVRHSAERDQSSTPSQAKVTVRPARTPIAAAAEALPDETVLRPLPVSLTSATHEWTEGDASDPRVIERIAHNPEEVVRMIEENARIKRRQLVYRKETLPNLLQRFGDESLKEFTLPGLDGREFEVEVMETRLNGLQAGSVMGRVKGVPDSLVSVGFYNGCESFNVSLPDEGFYLTADAREPGEVLVKEIDPNVYAPPTKCEPIVIE